MRQLALVVMFLFTAATSAQDAPIVNMTGAADDIASHVGGGKWSLVMVWSTACQTCQKETPAINAYHERHHAGPIRVLGVAINGYARKAAIEAFRTDYGMSFPTLVADPRKFMGHFKAETGTGFRGTPTFLIYAPDGQLAGMTVGPINLGKLDEYLAANVPD